MPRFRITVESIVSHSAEVTAPNMQDALQQAQAMCGAIRVGNDRVAGAPEVSFGAVFVDFVSRTETDLVPKGTDPALEKLLAEEDELNRRARTRSAGGNLH